MRDTTNELGFMEMDTDGSFDVERYDLRVGDSQLTINLKLLALGDVLTQIFDTVVESYKARTQDTPYRRDQAASLAYRFFTQRLKISPARA